MTMLRAGGLLDVLTSLSDSRQETVEKIMEWRISGVSYMCRIDFHNGIWGCGLLCTLLISFYFLLLFSSSFSSISRLTRRGLPRPISISPATTPRATTPHLYRTGHHAPSILHRPPRLYHHCTAITPVYIPATTPRATTPHLYHHVLSHPSE